MSAYKVVGYRTALFIVTLLGLFALFGVLASLSLPLVINAVTLAGCLSLAIGLRRRLGLGQGTEPQ